MDNVDMSVQGPAKDEPRVSERTIALAGEGIAAAVLFAIYASASASFGLFHVMLLAVIGFVVLNLVATILGAKC